MKDLHADAPPESEQEVLVKDRGYFFKLGANIETDPDITFAFSKASQGELSVAQKAWFHTLAEHELDWVHGKYVSTGQWVHDLAPPSV